MIIPALGFIFLSILYVKRDVYQDFGKHKNYSWKYFFQSLGDISTKKLLQNPPNYNSFIFGSSRSTGLYACYGQEKIKDAKFFHYANWNETIGGVHAKLKFLDARGYKLDNIFIYIDSDNSFKEDGRGSQHDHYFLTGQNKYIWYFKHYWGYMSTMDWDKLKILFGFPVSGEIFPNWESDPVTNDHSHICTDSVLKHYGNTRTDQAHLELIDSLKRTGFLYARPAAQSYLAKQISPYEVETLNSIKGILEKHQATYYIIITPLYDQMKFHPADRKILEYVFGSNLHDFSGINVFTNEPGNYPDRKHFLPYVSKAIMDTVLQ